MMLFLVWKRFLFLVRPLSVQLLSHFARFLYARASENADPECRRQELESYLSKDTKLSYTPRPFRNTLLETHLEAMKYL